MKKYFTISIILFTLLFLLLASLRFVYLDRIPAGLAHDEIIYSINRETMLRNGTDSGGVGLPTAFFMTKTEGTISILPVLLNVPVQALLPSDQIAARLPYAYINILTAVTIFFFTYFLLRNKTIAILATLLFLMNPWSFFLSRFATESPYTLVFLLLGITLSLKLRGWYLLLPFLFFTLAFFSYHGAKVVLLPVIIILMLFIMKGKLHLEKLSIKEATIFLSASVVLYLLFIIVGIFIPDSIIATRHGEIFFLDQDTIAKTVDAQRSMSIENPFTNVMVNKYTTILRVFIDRYLGAFSTSMLFISGDTRLIYSYGYHGLFYFFDTILITAGIIFLWMKERRKALLLIALILVAPLPSAVSGVEFSYVHRSFLLLPLFILLAATGLYAIYSYASQRIHHLLVVTILFCLICFPVIYFFHFYFLRYPITSGEYYSVDERILAKFIKESQSTDKQIINIVDNSGDVYFTSAYYANDDKVYQAVIDNIDAFNDGKYAYHKNIFRNDCPKFSKNHILVVQWNKNCKYAEIPQYIIRNPKDGGAFYKIYNSNLCDGVTLLPWRRHNMLADYAIEKMDRKTFCERWIAVP